MCREQVWVRCPTTWLNCLLNNNLQRNVFMKNFVSYIFLFCVIQAHAEYLRFEENGKIGIKDESGNIVLSPEFDELGWSDGSFSVVNGLTGYRTRQYWGLINLKKEFITGADFISLLKTDSDLFVAQKK